MQGYTCLLQNKDCVYSLEPHRRGGSKVYPPSKFLSKNKKKYQNISGENFHFFFRNYQLFRPFIYLDPNGRRPNSHPTTFSFFLSNKLGTGWSFD